MTDTKFNFEKHKHFLNRMFFEKNEKIKFGSKEHLDFWLFLKKYQEAQSNKQNETKTLGLIKTMETKMNPEWKDIKQLMKRMAFNDLKDNIKNFLGENRIIQFRNIVLLYMHFLETKFEKKMKKLQKDRSNLPIAKYKLKILETLAQSSVMLIAGDTGCGKSTQVPQYLLEAGYTNIACTQPRRIACISLSKRVAYENQSKEGTDIGYQIRFEKSKSKTTKILFITEGLMLRQINTDPLLSAYNVIILDEVHERHLSCDFILGIMKCLLMKRQTDLKLILMSATINAQFFSNYFGECPTIEVPGRLYPIELQYYPIFQKNLTSKSAKIDYAPYLKLLQLIDAKYPSNERGDMLIFLSGMNDILSVAEGLKSYAAQSKKWIILMLHSSLAVEVQDKVFDFAPEGVRKCILSTNIAETSVTIDGIRFVVDSGKMKEMSFDSNYRMQRLQEFWISKASAEQRKGRAGRTGPGVCFRLYSQKDFENFDTYSTPEIQRVPLDYLLLQMISMGLPDARKFPFLEQPSLESIEEALLSLKEHDALTAEESLTPMGKMLAQLPVDLTIGKMLILGSVFNITETAITLGAVLSVQSPFTLKSYRSYDAIEARRSLESIEGDPFVLLNAYNSWLKVKRDPNKNSLKWCKKRGLEEQRFYELTKLRKQFKDVLREAGLNFSHKPNTLLLSSDRIKRYKELKQLKRIKKELETSGFKKRKILKLRFDGECEDDQDNDDYDIKDIEFRLSHNFKEVEALQEASEAYTQKDIALLKVILCSGLYPQLAIPDEFNTFKKDSDQIFHTKNKSFVSLFPNSIFALDPTLYKINESDIVRNSSGTFSAANILLAYVSLLETNKPFLCNCLKVPAAHILLLFSLHLDTDMNFLRIVCDKWIEIKFASFQASQKFVFQACRVRDIWQKLFSQVFEECFKNQENEHEEQEKSDLICFLQKELTEEINSFLNISILHSLKRILAADLKTLYIGPEKNLNQVNLEYFKINYNDLKIDSIKGGYQIKSYLTYNCLRENDLMKSKLIIKEWTCQFCELSMCTSVLDQIRHQESCVQTKNYNLESSKSCDFLSDNNPLKKKHFCDFCKKTLSLTSTEILKHNKDHKSINKQVVNKE